MSYANNVLAYLAEAITPSDTTIKINKASPPYNSPPLGGGVLVLADSVGLPSKLEIISYESAVLVGAVVTLEGCVRAQEGTAALDWTTFDVCYQALTAAELTRISAPKPNLLDNSNFQIHQRGNDGATGGTHVDRWYTRAPNSTGGLVSVGLRDINTTSTRKFFRVTAAGNTAPWYIRQAFLTDKLVNGSSYTFSFKTGQMDSDITLSALLRGRDVSAGVWDDTMATLVTDITLTSFTEYSVTFDNINITRPLNGEGDYFQIELTGVGADNGSDFVLPDGAYRWEWFKLEEGNTFTGYEPTPYAVDEAECFKWFWRGDETKWASVYSNAANRGLCSFNYPTMYFIPTSYDVSTGGLGTVVLQNGPETSWVSFLAENFGSGGSNVNLKNVSCEL